MYTNILIVGGGFAGRSIAQSLQQEIPEAHILVLDPGTYTECQSTASQGMIHGGQRYTLEGSLTNLAQKISAMPLAWDNAIGGRDERLKLSGTKLLALDQYMFSPGDLGSKMVGFLASKAMRSRVEKMAEGSLPRFLQNKGFRGSVYRLDEKVIDVKSGLISIIKNVTDARYCHFVRGRLKSLLYANDIVNEAICEIGGDQITIACDHVIFAAGAFNHQIAGWLQRPHLSQIRPLAQLMVKPLPEAFYAHCLTTDPRPRVTISSHKLPGDDGEFVWYLGGLIAELGLKEEKERAISLAMAEMAKIFPFIDWKAKQWALFKIDRGEPFEVNGLLSQGPAIISDQNWDMVFPTKMTFMPQLCFEYLELWRHRTRKFTPIGNFPYALIEQNRMIEPLYPWEGVEWITPS